MALQTIPGRAIELGSDTEGDLAYHDGSKWTRLAKGTAGQFLATNSGATAPVWVDEPTSGSVVQMKSDIYSTETSTNVTYASPGLRRNTPFLISEGLEILSLTITPTSTSNYLRIFASGMFDASPDSIYPILVLHRDAITNGLQASPGQSWHGGDPDHCTLDHIMQVPSTSAQTYRIHVGQSGGRTTGTLFINRGNNSVGPTMWGGVGFSMLTVMEYVP
jgi:hypothetical protein